MRWMGDANPTADYNRGEGNGVGYRENGVGWVSGGFCNFCSVFGFSA